MKKAMFTILLALSCALFGAAEKGAWNAQNQFQNWGSPLRLTMTPQNGVMKLTITGRDPSLVISNAQIDPKVYSQFSFQYRAKGIPLHNSGQIFFAEKGKPFTAAQRFIFNDLRGDGEWHTVVVTRLVKGAKTLWSQAAQIDQLRFDPIDDGIGEFEIRDFRAIAPSNENCIIPGDDDFADVSTLHIQVQRMGKVQPYPFWIGKSNKFDHRHRGLFRFPLDKVLPRGKVKSAILEYHLMLYRGEKSEREYVVESLNADIQKLKALDVNAPATLAGKFRMGIYSVDEPVRVDVTEAVNAALEKVYSAVTLRVRPEPEPNLDTNPSGSGAIVVLDTVRLIVE